MLQFDYGNYLLALSYVYDDVTTNSAASRLDFEKNCYICNEDTKVGDCNFFMKPAITNQVSFTLHASMESTKNHLKEL